MRDFNTKIDNDPTSAGVVVAAEYNSVFKELKNVVSPFMGLQEIDSKQLVKSIDILTKSGLYVDNGTVNTVELSRASTNQEIETLFDGMMFSFIPAVQNTGAATLQVKTLDPKPLYYQDLDLVAGLLKTDTTYTVKYSVSNDRFDILKTYGTGGGGGSSISSNGFKKPNYEIPLFVKTGPSSLKVPKGTVVVIGENTTALESDFSLSLNTDLNTGLKVAGTDYYVYAKSNGDFFLSADKTLTTARLIGGFHYSLVPDGEVATGNKTEADMALLRGINAHTFWDLNFRPLCNPEGMFFANGRWYDIYLTNSEHITNGTSKVATGLKIAGGVLANGRLFPKIPLQYGGNNSLNYGKLTWLQAIEIAKSHKKDMISYSEFPTIAYGVVEGRDASSLDGGDAKIEHYPTLMSKYGMEQATGVQWIWAKDVTSAGGSAWQNVLDGRGQIYGSGYCGILGGGRGDGVFAGSRASVWSNVVWFASWNAGCRFACDHLQLV